VPDMTPEALLEHALSMNKFELEQDSIGEIVVLPREQAVLMTYYRNNIHHMLVMPSLIAAILMQHREISRAELLRQVTVIYPMLKSELFLRWSTDELGLVLDSLVAEMARQGRLIAEESSLRLSAGRFRTLQLLRNVPYSPDSTVPDMTPEALLEHALSMNKFELEQDSIGEIVVLPREQAVLMTYYRNNIHHMLVMPSLIAAILMQHREITRTELLRQVTVIYPMLKIELFLRWSTDELGQVLDSLVTEMARQGLLVAEESSLRLSAGRFHTLQLLAAGVRETLQRYSITFSILSAKPAINRGTLEKESRTMAQRLSVLHGINAPEFFDKAVFTSLVLTLRDEGYISDSGDAQVEQTQQVYQLLAELITQDVRMTIESAVEQDGCQCGGPMIETDARPLRVLSDPQYHANEQHQPYPVIIQEGLETAIALTSGNQLLLMDKKHTRHQHRPIEYAAEMQLPAHQRHQAKRCQL